MTDKTLFQYLLDEFRVGRDNLEQLDDDGPLECFVRFCEAHLAKTSADPTIGGRPLTLMNNGGYWLDVGTGVFYRLTPGVHGDELNQSGAVLVYGQGSAGGGLPQDPSFQVFGNG